LHSGRRHKRLKTAVEKGESHIEPKWRGPCVIVKIVEIPHIKGEEEEFQSSLIIEESLSPTQTRCCLESTTPCASSQSKVTVEDLSKALVVSGVNKNSNSQINRGNTTSQNQPTSPRGGATKNNMAMIENTLRLPEFQGVGSEESEQHLFIRETIWATKNV
jgi:hypothetical protein